jgi:CRISPR-associated endonuclease/helicase Cas3
MNTEFYAHTVEGLSPSHWQTLEDHLTSTAKRCGEMSKEFGCSEWGYLAGLGHDLGKFSPDFQRYIRATGDAEAHIEGSKLGRDSIMLIVLLAVFSLERE